MTKHTSRIRAQPNYLEYLMPCVESNLKRDVPEGHLLIQSRIPVRAIAIHLALMCIALGGCTAVSVKPVAAEQRIDHICIQENPRVQVADFVSVMQEGFKKHGISSQVVKGDAPAKCLFTSTYTARRSWDMAPYLSLAQIDIHRDGRPIASANYHLRAGGGLSLTKWANTRSKILPVIDELLRQLPPSSRVVDSVAVLPPAAEAKSQAAEQVSSELVRKLSELKDAHDAQLITDDEYNAKRKSLMDGV
jgi:hypothetical protein